MSFTRYADSLDDKKAAEMLQQPRGEPLRRVHAGELFRVQKTEDHWAQVARSKAFIADDFFPPRQLPQVENLQAIFAEEGDQERTEKLIEVIPKLNADQFVELLLYVALEAKINDRAVWRALE